MLVMVSEDIFATSMVAWVFYDSLIGLLWLPAVVVVNYKRLITSVKDAQIRQFDKEFKEMMLAISGALQSGYSIENAFKDAEENLRLIYSEKSSIVKDLREMNMKISMRESAERALLGFAKKHPTEEVLGLAQVFSFARRLGGDYIKNMRRTIEKLEEKLEIKQEIETSIAEKQMELKVLSAMPVMILAYIKISSESFLEALYHNAGGMVVMSICIVLYAVFVYMGKRIIAIEV